MKKSVKTTYSVLSFILSTMLIHSAPPLACSAEKEKKASSASQPAKPAKKLPDGFYHVLRESHTQSEVEPVAASERFLVYDFHLFEADERQPTKYVVLKPEPFVPLILGEAPDRQKDDKGKPNLLLKLAENQVGPLEEFTIKHLGGTVAIVIGGDIVTMHKIKSAIKGGRIQITRCSDHGCQVIYTELQKERAKK